MPSVIPEAAAKRDRERERERELLNVFLLLTLLASLPLYLPTKQRINKIPNSPY
jgi:hypothetical protein